MTFHQLCWGAWSSAVSGPTGWWTWCSSSHLTSEVPGSASRAGFGTVAGIENWADAVNDVSFWAAGNWQDNHQTVAPAQTASAGNPRDLNVFLTPV
jgi:hypothetical protein